MQTFKQHITEMAATKMPDEPKRDASGKPKVMTGAEAMKHFGKATMKAVMSHPLYKKHIMGSGHQGFAHSIEKSSIGKKWDSHIVHALTGGKGVRHRIDFRIGLSGRKVVGHDHFINNDGEKYPTGHPAAGRIKWKNIT